MFKALITTSGSCRHAFTGLWFNRTRGNVSWSPCARQSHSGFGEALSSVAFASAFEIESEDTATLAIQNIWSKDGECRLEEAVTLRNSYVRKYNWAKQTKELVDRIINLAHARNVDYLFFNGTLSGNDRKTKYTKM